MSGSITFNPFLTTQPQNTFLNPTQGYVQGEIYDDYVARSQLMGGYLDANETIVMWGGRPITEIINVTVAGASDGLGPDVKSAVSQATCTGWATFAASMVQIPGGAFAPVAAIGGFIPFFRYGSEVRMAVACDPALPASATGGTIVSQSLYWDVTNYRITLTTTGGNWALPTTTKLISTNATNSKIVTYAANQASWSLGTAAIIQI